MTTKMATWQIVDGKLQAIDSSLVDDGQPREPRYVRQPFGKEPDFGVTSVNYDLKELLAKSTRPC